MGGRKKGVGKANSLLLGILQAIGCGCIETLWVTCKERQWRSNSLLLGCSLLSLFKGFGVGGGGCEIWGELGHCC